MVYNVYLFFQISSKVNEGWVVKQPANIVWGWEIT